MSGKDSPIASASKHKSRTMTVAAQDLECTICLEVPASPIHTCANGHIICGICVDNIKKCGLCQSQPLLVNTLAERLSRQMDFKAKCPNYDAGCSTLIACTEIKEHIPKCYCRDAMCNERAGEVCNNVAIPLKDFPGHLREKHKCGQQRWTVSRCLETVNNKLPEDTKWPLEITVKFGQTFLLHSHVGKDAVFFWMTVLADKDEADKHFYKLTLAKELDIGKKIQCCWTLPVLPYHDNPTFNDPSSPYITIPAGVLYTFCEKVTVGEKTEYIFVLSHSIM